MTISQVIYKDLTYLLFLFYIELKNIRLLFWYLDMLVKTLTVMDHFDFYT